MVTQDAARAGRPSQAFAFMSALDIRWKAGSYGFGMAPAGTGRLYYSIAGLAYIPFKKPSGEIEKRTYFFGDFINDLVITCPPTPPCPASDKVGPLLLGSAAEALRSAIREALLTWPTSFMSDDVEYFINDGIETVVENDMFSGEVYAMPGGEGMIGVDHTCEM